MRLGTRPPPWRTRSRPRGPARWRRGGGEGTARGDRPARPPHLVVGRPGPPTVSRFKPGFSFTRVWGRPPLVRSGPRERRTPARHPLPRGVTALGPEVLGRGPLFSRRRLPLLLRFQPLSVAGMRARRRRRGGGRDRRSHAQLGPGTSGGPLRRGPSDPRAPRRRWGSPSGVFEALGRPWRPVGSYDNRWEEEEEEPFLALLWLGVGRQWPGRRD